MPLLETKGAASAQGFGLTLSSGGVTYIEDVFSTWLYTGNGSSQNIVNGIDLAGKGGMAWFAVRNYSGYNHAIVDTARDTKYTLYSNTTAAQVQWDSVTPLSNGFSVNNASSGNVNQSGSEFVSWTFRKQPKFFDVVTYTGNGTSGRTVAHNLGSTPGCMIIKKTNSVGDWYVYHRSLTSASFYLLLNSTDTQNAGVNLFNSTAPTDSVFTLGSGAINTLNDTYVAYLFAHNAGGFGLSGTDNVITCGTYTGNGLITGPAITLDYEPQFLLIKSKDGSTGNWYIFDVMRGLSITTDSYLYANSTSAELSGDLVTPTSTGFQLQTSIAGLNASGSNYIYIAIRRGPMKVPTSGTSVFAPLAYVGDQSTARRDLDVGFVVDAGLFLNRTRTDYSTSAFTDRLRGAKSLTTSSTSAESDLSGYLWFDDQNGIDVGQIGDLNPVVAGVGQTMVLECLKRAPGFFDVVCYTGTGTTNNALTHNLGVAPELVIIKSRSFSPTNWPVATGFTSTGGRALNLNQTGGDGGAEVAYGTGWQIGSQPTATTLTIGGTANAYNGSGQTYVMYLFATCPGVSKVGSYTGTGTTQQINCGFTGGARFVLIKRTDSTGDWYVWDSARGIVAGNDPHLSLNSTAAEVTTNDSIDTDSTGFIVNQLAATNINVSSATYIFLAIA